MDLSEDSILDLVRTRFPTRLADLGIGDDAAILASPGCRVVSTDTLVDEVDFTRAIPPRFVGWKCLAANLSDIAAMGARARGFLLTLGLPGSAGEIVSELLDGLKEYADREQVELVGGDLTRSATLFVSITILGDLVAERPLVRDGASPGDRLYVSRPLGGSTAGLALIRNGWTIGRDGSVAPPSNLGDRVGFPTRELAASLLRQHVAPEAETALGCALATHELATACIDISDGFSTDLHRLCRASGCGAEVEAIRVPVFQDLPAHAASLGIDASNAALHGGEEYALLFTSRLRESELSSRLGRPVYAIGRIVEGDSVAIETESGIAPLENRGYDHFARQA